MQDYLNTLSIEFKQSEDTKNALKQKAYMRGQFNFYGLTAVKRREITKPFLVKDYLPNKSEFSQLIKMLWQKPQREYQLFAMDLALKYVKHFEEKDIELLEYMILNKSWWDTVDVVADKLVGKYFQLYPKKRDTYINKWLKSDNIWLQRSTLLFQLKYKTSLDTKILSHCINSLLGSKEFFINKAIGWVLRQYSVTNPDWVIDFVHNTELSNLSKKEALRLIKKNV